MHKLFQLLRTEDIVIEKLVFETTNARYLKEFYANIQIMISCASDKYKR